MNTGIACRVNTDFYTASGTHLELDECPAKSNNVEACTAIFMSLHITECATAYLQVFHSHFDRFFADFHPYLS